MPGAKAEIPIMSERPLPASRPPADQPLRRLPAAGRVHRRDPSGAWVEDELAPLADVESEDEFSALERDAKAQIRALRDDRKRLSLPSLTDEKVRTELANVESRLLHAERELERIPLAREEVARRTAEALATAEEKRCAAARAAADKLLGKRVGVMRRFDVAARELAQAIVECEALSLEADQKLQEAGERPGAGMLGPKAYENALGSALVSAGVSGRAVAFEGAATGHLGPLAPEPAKS
jgi:hypothetical protein